VDRANELEHLENSIAALQTKLQQTLQTGQSSAALLADHKKTLSLIIKQNGTLIGGGVPIPILGSKLRQIYKFFNPYSPASLTPKPDIKTNKQLMKRLAVERAER